MFNVEFGSGRVYSIAVVTALLSIMSSVSSVGSLNLFSHTVTGYPNMTWTDESPLRGPQEGFSFWRNVVFEEKTTITGREAGRDCFSCFVYTPGMTFGEGKCSLSRQPLIVGLLIYLIY